MAVALELIPRRLVQIDREELEGRAFGVLAEQAEVLECLTIAATVERQADAVLSGVEVMLRRALMELERHRGVIRKERNARGQQAAEHLRRAAVESREIVALARSKR